MRLHLNIDFFKPAKLFFGLGRSWATVGLGPLEEYAKYFDIEYVLPKSKTKAR